MNGIPLSKDVDEDAAEQTPAVVVLVDDQAMVAEAIRRMVSDENIEFHYCPNPRDALDMAVRVKASVILQDLVMPDIDGMTLVRFYRSNPATHSVPVIVLSTKEDPKIKSDAFRSGANDYLVKLPDKIELVARIHAHSKSYRAQQERDAAYQALREMQQKLEQSHSQLEVSNRELQRLSSLDGLTGIANRRQFDHVLDREWRRSTRNHLDLSLILIDIDFFKMYNDNYGHQAGDDCLKSVANALSRVARRPADLTARYGGEEFAVILPETDEAGAKAVATRLIAAIDELQIPHAASKASDKVTLSIGTATVRPKDRDNPDGLVAAADEALYRAKENGRHRIEISS